MRGSIRKGHESRPERWAPSAQGELDQTTGRYREKLYLWLEAQASKPFVLGTTVSALDVYVAVLVAWRPRIGWFEQNTPKIARIVERTRLLPPVADVMRSNGW